MSPLLGFESFPSLSHSHNRCWGSNAQDTTLPCSLLTLALIDGFPDDAIPFEPLHWAHISNAHASTIARNMKLEALELNYGRLRSEPDLRSASLIVSASSLVETQVLSTMALQF